MACTAIVGINWGDEGKGRMVDLLTEAFDVVVRFQGGGNVGHDVINQYGRFKLHTLPSGVVIGVQSATTSAPVITAPRGCRLR